MEKMTIVVYDYSTCSVDIFHNVPFDDAEYDDASVCIEDYLTEKGYKLSNITYMACNEGELTLTEHNND